MILPFNAVDLVIKSVNRENFVPNTGVQQRVQMLGLQIYKFT